MPRRPTVPGPLSRTETRMLSPQGAHLPGEGSRDWLAQWVVVASDPDHTHRFLAWREDPNSTG